MQIAVVDLSQRPLRGQQAQAGLGASQPVLMGRPLWSATRQSTAVCLWPSCSPSLSLGPLLPSRWGFNKNVGEEGESPVGGRTVACLSSLGSVGVCGQQGPTLDRGGPGTPSSKQRLWAGARRLLAVLRHALGPWLCDYTLPRTQGPAEDGRLGSPGMFGFSRAIVVPGGKGCGHARSSDRGTRKGRGLCSS